MAILMLKANDAEEANNFHAATQKSVRTSGFRIPGDHSCGLFNDHLDQLDHLTPFNY